MNIIPRRLVRQDLDLVDVFIEDTENEFIVVKDIPDVFSQGRNTFKIFGSEFLKEGIKLKIEILDRLGNTVFVNPIKYRLNQYGLPTLPYSYVSVEVYRPPINVGGAATLSILAELDDEKVPFDIPIDFIGRYNVRYQTKINIDVSKVVNTSPILFYKKPIITAQEVVKKRLVAPGTLTASTVTVSGSGLTGKSTRTTTPERYYPNPQNTTTTSTGETQKDTAANANLMEDVSDLKDGPGGNITEILNKKEFKTGEERVPSQFARIATPRLFLSEEPPVMKIRATGSGTFNSKMVGATIKIPKESITVFYPQQYIGLGNVGVGTGFGSFPQQADLPGGDANLETAGVFISDYTGSIEKVVNDKEIHVKEPFYFRYGPGSSHPSARYYLADFGNNPYIPESAASSQRANFTMSFVDNVPATTSSFAFDSFVDLTIKNTRTFSGDVYRVRVSGGSMTRISDFPILLETVLESPQLLVDTSSPSGVKRTGYFQSQAHIDQYWNTEFGMTATYDNTRFIDSVKLSGSFSADKQNGSFLLDKSQTTFTVDKDVAYELSFRIFGKKGPKIQPDGTTKEEAKIFFHVSGSNIAGDTNPKYANAESYGSTIRDEHGNKIGLFLGESDPSELTYEKVSHAFTIPFKLDRISNDDTVIKLRVESGEWTIQDLSLRPALDTGFSPDQFKIRVPLPTNTQRPDRFRFILNYYSQDNVEAEEISEIKDVEVQGEALLIQGEDNLVKGTVTIGNVQGEGVEIKGGNSAYIRAVGYTGFKDASAGTGGGFFLWSGSVAPGGVTQDNYTGAGLEIHDGNTGANESFFKFRTVDADNNNNSTFDVKTSRFFLGSTGSAFISGSNGNIQISSSNLHLTAQGNITASNFLMDSGVIRDTVQILGSVSANSILTPASIGGSPSNVLNASSSISSQGFAKFVSASIAGFIVNTEEIKSSNETLRLKASGQITGSDVLFDGGTIGGFTLTSTALTGGSAGTTVALTPGTGIHLGNASFGSAPFSVTNAGVIKATSGTIGGFTLTSNAISSSNLLLEDSGEIKTSNFATRLQGFRISAKGNGTAEFENIRIRGTLKTTTFEKETVNAVGGRLYVANSTVLSGSATATDTSLKVENASGFEVGEIIFAKKVTGTGFTKEFMQITSISRQDPADDTDFTGFLHVERSFGGAKTGSAITDTGTDLNGSINKTQTSLTVDGNSAVLLNKRMIKIDDELMMVSGSPSATVLQVHRGVDGSAKATHADDANIFVLDKDTAFLFGLVSTAEDYTEGQVLVSTGRFLGGTGTNTTGSGFIELNANPTTGDTPFIEMVERTGSGIYDMERRLVLGDLSGFVGSAIGNRVDLPDNPGFGLASENVFLSGGIKANSGSIGGIKMVSQKIFTGTGTHGNSNTGFFASASGDFSLKDKIVFTAGSSNLVVNPNTLDLNTTSLRVSSSNGGVVALGPTAPTNLSSAGIFLTGSGAFNLQQNVNYIRGDSDGIEINFPNFSVTKTGILTATDGNFNGRIEAETGFFGSDSTNGWQIDGNRIKSNVVDASETGSIEIDATPLSPNITLTSGSFVAEIVPDFTPGSTILAGGGDAFSDSDTKGSPSANEADSGAITISSGSSSSALTLVAGFSDGTTADYSGTRNKSATLTANTNYRSAATIGVNITVAVPNNSQLAYTLGGFVRVAGTFALRDASDNSVIGEAVTLNSLIVPNNTGALSFTKNVVINHSIGGSNKNVYWEVSGLTATNVALVEDFATSLNPFSPSPTIPTNITRVEVFYTNTSHEPANKKTELAPAGFQSVLLLNSTINSNLNKYVRISPEESKTLDVLGDTHFTGSVTVGDNSNAGTGFFSAPQGSTTKAGFRFNGRGTDMGFVSLTSTSIGVIQNNAEKFRFSTADNKFHSDGDVIAFSNTISDKRFKENIVPIDNSLGKVLKLRGVEFDWKDDYKERGHDLGFIAQEVEKVDGLSVLVSEGWNIRTKKEDVKVVSYEKVVPLLVEAIREQQKQIDDLKKKLEEL